MPTHKLSPTPLADLGPASGLVILAFRACAFGRADCCCVRSGLGSALGPDAEETLADILVLTRLIGSEGQRRIGLSAPGCGRMTADEAAIAAALTAAQAWDEPALDAQLSALLGLRVPQSLRDLVVRIADSFAGHGLAFRAPRRERAAFGGLTPAFRAF